MFQWIPSMMFAARRLCFAAGFPFVAEGPLLGDFLASLPESLALLSLSELGSSSSSSEQLQPSHSQSSSIVGSLIFGCLSALSVLHL
jgi:hypothetical protein